MKTKNSNALEPREQWGTRLGFMLAAAGSAIGMGNIWRFPFVVGESGGAAFVLLYLGFVLMIGLPLLIGEVSIGRRGRSDAMGSYQAIQPNRQAKWYLNGLIGVVVNFLVLSFYSVVAGWAFYYLIQALTGQLISAEQNYGAAFGAFTEHPIMPIIWQVILMTIVVFIVMSGVKKGIEKWNNILMPTLFVLLMILVFRSVSLENAGEGLQFFLQPDFSVIDSDAVLAALGQAFFSLGLASGLYVTYGSYNKNRSSIPANAGGIVALDLLVAIMAGLIIFPAVFHYGIDPGSGPELVFITFPAMFTDMAMGGLFAVVFFFFIFVSALTSAISLLEVVVAFVKERFGLSRKTATPITAVVITFIGVFASLSFGPLSHVTIFDRTIFELFDFLSAEILLPIAGLVLSIFLGWIWKPLEVRKEVEKEGNVFPFYPLWAFLIRYVIPGTIVIIFIDTLGLLG
ncbi:sodium-dependent transporter [Texcoconibacillus texcoconensis]|uniref:Transporter n=1 Tax=Texcoconibacillus texcoconensis TaxID=1095777 RepID=A0A840QR81_9BACI|nr:sodium-dependent transporter [Texcoconibacillus texcoconensis]MBB5173831.1 NSS family neurotransmitter:Na+ symporter [Texcoconibacillus texcoconensis]